MITAETGVYLQFFDEGESFDAELPPIGPFELLIIRHNRIIGDREHIDHDMLGAGSVERWLEAELELRRALGDEPGGVKRAHMRIRAPRGDIIVRFYDYGGDEPPKVPELGPFYTITVGKREVRADDKLLAIRSTDMSAWTLTDAVRPGIAGINKADFSLFSLSARDLRPGARPPAPAATPISAPSVATRTAPPSGPAPEGPPKEFVERRTVQREIYVARPDPRQDETLTPADVNLILRVDRLKQQELAEQLMIERLRKAQHVSPEAALHSEALASVPMRFQPPVKEREAAEAVAAQEEEAELSLSERILGTLWAGRLFIVTGLLIIAAISAYGYLKPRAAAGNEPPPLKVAAMREKITTPSWQYTVVSVERPVRIGTTPATTGGYLIVHVTISRKDPDAPPPDPGDFVLIDASGARALAFSTTSNVYGPSTGINWPTRYALNAFTQNNLVFDASPSARGLLLLIKPANVEVRLPDP